MPIPDQQLPEGYAIRCFRPDDWDDLVELAAATNAAFKRGNFHQPGEIHTWVTAPSYRNDLDLVAIAPDGSIAAFCTMWYDERNGHGKLEPVGTHPDHQRRGLASAVMYEAMRRVKALGGKSVGVETGAAMAANHLYESVGLELFDYDDECWKELVVR